ncbi:MAG TPA: hypothetical protein VGG01_22280 [Xanthobacteraceae bacterium]
MSVSSIAPLPAFQPLTLAPNTNNKNGQNGANKPNGTNGANTNNASGQAEGPPPANGGDNGNQATGVTRTNPPNQQPPLPQNGQGTGLSINMLV